ncbi:MAG TPA: PKD domain-containing protein, partial [Candidatus Thermoplasmatota archaeon]|nr:PKD domain-containing protein [Candidatus Thermoplasmatota archaeon]
MKVQTLLLALVLAAVPLAGCTDSPSEPSDGTNPDGGDGGTGGDPNSPLKAVIKLDPETGITKDTAVTFDATSSTGPIEEILWNFGDGERRTDEKLTHTFAKGDATYTVTLTVKDADGKAHTARKVVKVGTGVNLPPVPVFTTDSRWVTTGTPITVDATGTTDPEGDEVTYFWS